MVANVKYDGSIYIKVPIYLIDYKIEFYIRCRNSKTSEYMAKSETTTVNIPSFLLENNYKVDEIVQFRDEETFYTSPGKIVDILDENKYKIAYYKHSAKQELVIAHETVHVSRIYRKGTEMQYEIDLIPTNKMKQNLLIRRHDTESQIIFKTLVNVYYFQSFAFCLDQYGDEEAVSYYEGLAVFVAKYIFDCLYEPQFYYKVDCLLDGDRHSVLHLRNLRQSHIATKLEMKVAMTAEQYDRICYQCDCCGTGIRDYDFVYQCSADPLNRHDFCLNCVNTVIVLNGELRTYLDEVLNDNLNNDCIQMIISYVIGNVVCL